MNSFDRYNPFKLNGKIKMVPFINIRKKILISTLFLINKQCD